MIDKDHKTKTLDTNEQIDMIKHNLRELGERALKIAERISYKSGIPLEGWEKDIIKMSLMPGIKEAQRRMNYGFAFGDDEMWQDGYDSMMMHMEINLGK